MKKRLNRFIITINKVIVVLLFLIAIVNIVTPLFMIPYTRNIRLFYYIEIHRTIRRLISFIILIIAWKLYKRVGATWSIVMLVLSISIFQYLLINHHRFYNPVFLLEATCYIILLFSKNYYCRKMDRYSITKGVLVYLLYTTFVFFNAVTALFKEKGTVSFIECIKQTVNVMLSSDNITMQNAFYHSFIFWFSWICIITGLILVLTPYINKRAHNKEEIETARRLVLKYGQNCSSYLALEKDKSLYFGESVEGVIAYGIVRDILVVLGDPICAPEDFIEFLAEIKSYCEKNAYSLLFMNTTGMYLDQYGKLGMGITKCGAEPRFYLPEYSIAGGKAAKFRLNVNHAANAGLTVKEYDPRKSKDALLEKEITEVSQEWFTMKKSGELIFTMGGINFDNPMDRRYFYAVNPDNKVEGFIVFVPFGGMNGYMADVTRHRKNSVRGVMEKIFYEAMMTFKAEGAKWGSTAVAPLAGLENESEVTGKLLNKVYEKMNSIYGFKTLYETKQKYNPTCWEQSYYVCFPAIFTPSMALAIIKIQNPQGVKDYIKAFLKNRLKATRSASIETFETGD